MTNETKNNIDRIASAIARIGIPAAFGLIALVMFGVNNYLNYQLDRERTSAFVSLTSSLSAEMDDRGKEHAEAALERGVILSSLQELVRHLCEESAKNPPAPADPGGT